MSSTIALAWRHPAAAVLLAALALTGCSGSADNDAGSTGTDAVTTAGAEPTEESSAEPSEQPTEVPPSAADGTDYSKCDSRCEVEVRAGVEIEYGAFTMVVADVAADQVQLSTNNGEGSTSSASITPGCTVFLTESSAGVVCSGIPEVPPEPEVAAGQVAVDLLHLGEDGTAIVRIVAG
ncbi:hypothetical protein AB0K52_23490 [Glycomyces sp. NPDC049804]|uniref:hypothetical protein n=1 Tax=Glycomyces sp. NPDC049804 TaxID=3154363 RepID=UPI00343C98C3